MKEVCKRENRIQCTDIRVRKLRSLAIEVVIIFTEKGAQALNRFGTLLVRDILLRYSDG